MAEATGLVRLAALLANAKAAEATAQAERIVIEELIIAAAGFCKSDGQESYEESTSEGYCKLVIKQPVRTTVDDDAWVSLRKTLDTKHRGRTVFVTKYSLDAAKARVLQDSNPLAWRDISPVITRKPGKISVEVKEVSVKAPGPNLGALDDLVNVCSHSWVSHPDRLLEQCSSCGQSRRIRTGEPI